jgi:hypothetical protein
MAIADEQQSGAAQPGELKPEWLRPKDMPRFFGLGRTQTYQLISEGKIKSVSLRKRGQKHGTRLISYQSVVSFLESLTKGKEL